MAEIRINKNIWEAISNEEKDQLIKELIEHKVLKTEDTIVPDADVPRPSANTPLYSATVGDVAMKAMFPEWACVAACDAIAATAIAVCTASGALLAACTAIIAAAREACKNKCAKLG